MVDYEVSIVKGVRRYNEKSLINKLLIDGCFSNEIGGVLRALPGKSRSETVRGITSVLQSGRH